MKNIVTYDDDETMSQRAPFPTLLAALVEGLQYKPGWTFNLSNLDRGQGSEGLTLSILISTLDAYHSDRKRSVVHYMLVPPAAFDKRSWRRWLLDQVLLVEQHEACEFFRFEYLDMLDQVTDVERPYAPSHGPGNDPYMIREVGTNLDQRTSFRGEVNA